MEDDNNEVELEAIWEGLDWGRCSLGQRKCLSVCCERGKDLRFPSHAGNFLTNCGTISFSRRIAPRGKLIGR